MYRDLHHGKPCPYCKRPMDRRSFHLQPTRDHVIPRCRGGRKLIICCLKCNGIKGDMLPDVWAAYMAANPGWWKLSKAELRRRRRMGVRKYDHPNCKGNLIRQGSPPPKPVIVPPEFIWPDLCNFGQGLTADRGGESVQLSETESSDEYLSEERVCGVEGRAGPAAEVRQIEDHQAADLGR